MPVHIYTTYHNNWQVAERKLEREVTNMIDAAEVYFNTKRSFPHCKISGLVNLSKDENPLGLNLSFSVQTSPCEFEKITTRSLCKNKVLPIDWRRYGYGHRCFYCAVEPKQ